VVTRKGIRYELDLSEGIDLSIFLFGNFQKHVFNSSYFKCSENPIIFDIGANIGHMTLTYAMRFPEAKIFAFEPTDFASKKLKRNLELNPALAKNVSVVKAFVSDKTELVSDIKAFASWKVDGHYDDSGLFTSS
jgi:tRNA G46 methylase TrmB